MDVTDVLRDRMQEPGGLQSMTTLSFLVHGTLIALVLLAPGRWLARQPAAPTTAMTIVLSGSEGAATGGMTPMGGRSVQEVKPPEEVAKRGPARPPAPKPPEMTLPVEKARPVKPQPAPPVKVTTEEARGKTATRGAHVEPGSAVAPTGAHGVGFGLSTGGGAGSGSYLDVANFCCPEYIA